MNVRQTPELLVRRLGQIFRNLLAGSVFVAVQTLTSTTAGATTCGAPTPSEHVANTPVVFFGLAHRELPTRLSGERGTNRRVVVEFKVLRAYKGVTGDIFRVEYLDDGGANKGWGFSSHQPAMVFAGLTGDQTGAVHYCTMIHYAARPNLHPQYWDILAPLNSKAHSKSP